MDKKNIKEIERLMGEIGGCSFGSITYRNQKGEKSRYTVRFGVDHGETLKKDVANYPAIRERLYAELSETFGEATALKALAEKEESLRTCISGTNVHSIAQKESYVHAGVTGVKFGIDTRKLYLYAYVQTKVVLEKGEYKPVKSRPLTLAKKRIEKELLTSKYRTFIIEEDQLERIKTGGETLEFSNV